MNNCYICKSEKLIMKMPYRAIAKDLIFQGASIVQCTQCGLLQINRNFTDQDIEKYYRQTYNREDVYGFDIQKFPFDNLWSVYRGRALAKLMQSKFPKQHPTVMDLGCGYGHLIYGFNNYLAGDANLIGVEYDNRVQSLFEEKGWMFIHGGLDDVLDKYRTKIDVLITSHVFEHVLHPSDFLQKCRRMLTDNGILLWEVPNLDLRNLKCETRHSPHICLWDIKSLTKILTDNNFEIIFLDTAGKKYRWFDVKTPAYQLLSKIIGRFNPEKKYDTFNATDKDQIDFQLDQYGNGRRNLRFIAKKAN